MSSGRKRVLVIGDPAYNPNPAISLSNTGFGIATGQIISALNETGEWDVIHLPRGMMQHHAPKDPNALNYRLYIPPANDPNGWHYAGYICDWENPHLVIFESDPGSITEWRKNTQVRRIPNLTHGPVEGAPLTRPWSDTMKEILIMGNGLSGAVTLYTDFAKQTLYAGMEMQPDWSFRPVEVLGLGVDHAPFRAYSPEERDEIRKRLGWTDKFVVMNVARNAGRKMWPRLLEAIRIVRESFKDVVLYAHTLAFENYYLGGWNLFEICRTSGLKVGDDVIFYQKLRDGMVGIPYLDQQAECSLIDLYNASNLFVSVSGGEGWNLPATEAAACGLPVIAPMYSGGWEVARDFAVGIEVKDFETHPSGAKMAAVNPRDIANEIIRLYREQDSRTHYRQKGLQKAKGLLWKPTTDRLAELARELVRDS